MYGKKLILVVGATGAQGIAVIVALLAPGEDGSTSPYAVRALTRDPDSKRAQALTSKGVACEARELFAGMRIFEFSKQIGTVRHYIYSNLDYVAKTLDGKRRVGDWLKSQSSDTSEDGMTWSVVTTVPYMDMLKIPMFGPLTQRADGTFVFAPPVGDGHVPMITLRDIGFFARYSFDHRHEVSSRDLEVARQIVGWDGPDGLIEVFQRVTGQKAVFIRQTINEWMDNFDNTDLPFAVEAKPAGTSLSWRKNFSAFWRLCRYDMDWIHSINPYGDTLESWMRENKYTGEMDPSLLKGFENNAVSHLKPAVIAKFASAAT